MFRRCDFRVLGVIVCQIFFHHRKFVHWFWTRIGNVLFKRWERRTTGRIPNEKATNVGAQYNSKACTSSMIHIPLSETEIHVDDYHSFNNSRIFQWYMAKYHITTPIKLESQRKGIPWFLSCSVLWFQLTIYWLHRATHLERKHWSHRTLLPISYNPFLRSTVLGYHKWI